MDIAIKVIDKKSLQGDEYMLNGLYQEIKVMKKLKSEYVVRLLDILETSNNFYMVQEFCDGGDLGA